MYLIFGVKLREILLIHLIVLTDDNEHHLLFFTLLPNLPNELHKIKYT